VLGGGFHSIARPSAEATAELRAANILVDSTLGSTPSSDRFGTKHALIASLYRLVRVKKSTNRSESARSHAQLP
jgi:hypothetical protein